MTRTSARTASAPTSASNGLPLALVTVSGLIYNIGLLATPWFEGGWPNAWPIFWTAAPPPRAMAILVLTYVLVTLVVAGGAVHQALLRAPLCQ